MPHTHFEKPERTSFRTSRTLRSAIEQARRAEGVSLGEVLEIAARRHLRESRRALARAVRTRDEVHDRTVGVRLSTAGWRLIHGAAVREGLSLADAVEGLLWIHLAYLERIAKH